MKFKNLFKYVCHQMPERCYHFCEEPLHICSRCLGVYSGFLVSFLIMLFFYGFFSLNTNSIWLILFFYPMAFDWVTQYFKLRKSDNDIRFVSGYLGGTALGYMVYSLLSGYLGSATTSYLPVLETLIAVVPMYIMLNALEKHHKTDNKFMWHLFNTLIVGVSIILIISIVVLYTDLFLALWNGL
ncbi:MAG: DUF2085 domain-containing protein [archaeon]